MITIEEIQKFLGHVEELELENQRLRQLISEHHNVSRLQALHVGDTCPVCEKAGLASWPYSPDAVHTPP